MIKNQKFTIGEISSEWHTKTTNKTFGIDYSYVVKNKKYVGQTKENLKISEKYLVVFDSLNPNNATLISEYGLNNYKSNFDGWTFKNVPFKIDSIFVMTKLKTLK